MGKTWGWFVAFTRDNAIGAALAKFVIPAMLSLGAGVLSYFESGVPLWVAATVGVFVLWAAASAANNFNAMTERSSVRNRLAVKGGVATTITNATTNTVEAITLGVALQNTAPYPVEYEIEEIHSQYGGRVNANRQFTNRGSTIYPFQETSYVDASIPVEAAMLDSDHSGELSVVIRYWRLGGMKHTMKFKARLNSYMARTPDRCSFQWVWPI